MGAVREALRERQLPSIDAFRAFNASQNGLISCSELYGGLVWLGMDVKPPNVYELVRQMDKDDDGLVSWDEWLRAIGRVMPSEAHSTPGDEDLDAILDGYPIAREKVRLAAFRMALKRGFLEVAKRMKMERLLEGAAQQFTAASRAADFAGFARWHTLWHWCLPLTIGGYTAVAWQTFARSSVGLLPASVLGR